MALAENGFLERPRENLMATIILIACVWHVGVGLCGVLLYWAFIEVFEMKYWWLSLICLAFMVIGLIMHQKMQSAISLTEYFHYGLRLHFLFWKYTYLYGIGDGVKFLLSTQLNYLIGLSCLVGSILGAIDNFFSSPYSETLRSLKNKTIDEASLLSDKKIKPKLAELSDVNSIGTVLGISRVTGQAVIVPDKFVNEILMVLGTTGSGKTITLRRFYQRAIMQGHPLIIVDGKPDDDNIAWVMNEACKYNRPFYGFNCGSFNHYDCLSNGGYTELKDKIMCLKDTWTSDHYKSLAEDYIQTAFKLLIRAGKPFDLRKLAICLNHHDLLLLAREVNDQPLMDEVERLDNYKTEDLTGVIAHLNILINSELGAYFDIDPTAFTLPKVIEENAILYFALPALRFPGYSKVLGSLVINDLKAAIDRRKKGDKNIFAVFDEFSVFAGEQSLNLVNMGRGKGLHAIFGTQGLADLEKENPLLKRQIMNCVNSLICHRLNDHEDAESIANWIGTHDAFSLTAQLNLEKESKMASIRKSKEFIVHPDSIKQELPTGEAFYISKVSGFNCEQIKVKFS